MELTILTIALLCIVTAIVCFFASMVGTGSGLILVPLLVLSGLTPVQAIAVHKFEALWTVVSGYRYYKHNCFLKKDFLFYLLLGGIGTFLGALHIHYIPDEYLRMIIGASIIFSASIIAFMRNKPQARSEDWWKRLVLICSMFLFGLYEGTFGSGNGFFIAALFFALIGSNEAKTVGTITLLAAVWNIIATTTHFSFGSLQLEYALPIGLSAMMGAWFGSGYAIKCDKKVIRKTMIVLALIGGSTMLFL